MTMTTLIGSTTVIPVLTVDDEVQAVLLARALVQGGLKVLEVTLRTAAALAAVEAIRAELPDAVVGVGTVIRAEQIEDAAAAGAAFAVSPGFSPDVLAAARKRHLPFLPGAATPSEIIAALEEGLELLKFFPAHVLGGVEALRALAPVFPEMRFCPTGGVGEANLADYLALPNVLCVGGGWVAPPGAVAAGDWEAITLLARRAAAFGR